MRCQAGRKAAPRCVEQDQCTVTAVWVQELHQVLGESMRTNVDNYIFNRVKFCVGMQHSAINQVLGNTDQAATPFKTGGELYITFFKGSFNTYT